jgi:hypothetical protein
VPAVRIVVTGLIATYPVGGVTWDYLQYVHGLVALGHTVTYLEDTGQWVYSPRLQTFTERSSENLEYLERVLAPCAVSWAFRDPRGVLHGLDGSELIRRCREADLFLNVSGAVCTPTSTPTRATAKRSSPPPTRAPPTSWCESRRP